MSRHQRIRNLYRDGKRRLRINTGSRKSIGERAPLDELHHDERTALIFSDFVNRADVGMIDACSGSCLSNKPASCVLVATWTRCHQLDGDLTIEGGVFGQVNLTHAARAKFLDNRIM